MTKCYQCSMFQDVNKKLEAAEDKVRVLREALEEIAKTDSPWSADFAREALEKVK